MKVASVVLNDFTRDNRVLKENMSFLKAGFDPKIIALHQKGLQQEEHVNGVPVKRIVVKSRSWPKSMFISAFKYLEFLFKALRQTRGYDVVHCNDLETLPVGFMRKKISPKVKLVYDAHEFETGKTTTGRPIRMKLNKILERLMIKAPDIIITVSESIAEEYCQMYGIKKPALIYNCPPLSMHNAGDKHDLFREEFGIAQDKKIFLYQGGFTKGRGIDLTIEAFKGFDDKVVVFMGYGPYLQQVIDAAEQFDNIFYHEAVPFEQLVKYSKSADWGLITIENVSKSYYYSLPNKLFEYVVAGIPYVALPTLEIKNKTLEYHTGLVAEYESAESLRETVLKTDQVDYEEFNPGLKEMREIFNWENQEKKLIEIYSAL